MPLSVHLRLLSIQFTCAFLLSGAITFINKGLGDGFLASWGKGFILSFILIPFVVKLIPILSSFLAKHLLRHMPVVIFKCLTALCVAIMMETVIAFALTSFQHGWHTGFLGQWLYATLLALPVGLCIGLCMVFVIQPKIQALIEEGKRLAAAKKAQA
jgi:hypothetical protein